MNFLKRHANVLLLAACAIVLLSTTGLEFAQGAVETKLSGNIVVMLGLPALGASAGGCCFRKETAKEAFTSGWCLAVTVCGSSAVVILTTATELSHGVNWGMVLINFLARVGLFAVAFNVACNHWRKTEGRAASEAEEYDSALRG